MLNISKIIQDGIKRHEDRAFKLAGVHADNVFDNDQMRAAV